MTVHCRTYTCSRCKKSKSSNAYSRRQLKQHKRRCKSCISNLSGRSQQTQKPSLVKVQSKSTSPISQTVKQEPAKEIIPSNQNITTTATVSAIPSIDIKKAESIIKNIEETVSKQLDQPEISNNEIYIEKTEKSAIKQFDESSSDTNICHKSQTVEITEEIEQKLQAMKEPKIEIEIQTESTEPSDNDNGSFAADSDPEITATAASSDELLGIDVMERMVSIEQEQNENEQEEDDFIELELRFDDQDKEKKIKHKKMKGVYNKVKEIRTGMAKGVSRGYIQCKKDIKRSKNRKKVYKRKKSKKWVNKIGGYVSFIQRKLVNSSMKINIKRLSVQHI